MNSLHIEVRALAGSHVADIINDQCALANRIGIAVHCKVNGVLVMAKPLCDPAELYGLWEAELSSSRQYKICCGHPAVTDAKRPEYPAASALPQRGNEP